MEQPGNRHSHAERLDKDVLRASLSAEKQTRKYQKPEWSVALAKARTKVMVLKKCLSMVRTGIDCLDAIYPQLADGIFSDDLVPTNKHECIQQLRQARQEVTKIVNESYDGEKRNRKQRFWNWKHQVARQKLYDRSSVQKQ